MTKPKSPRQWNSTVPSRSKPLPRGGRPKARNANRRAKEFARCYGSVERVEWVKARPCAFCVLLGLARIPPESDNAHTAHDGAGRKAGYETIVELCRAHHCAYDGYWEPFDQPSVRLAVSILAKQTHEAWQSHCAGGSGGGGTPE